jgi:hypothetical protein
MSGPHAIDLTKYPQVAAWFDRCKMEMKGYEEAVDKGAVEWGKLFAVKSEGKAIR